MTQRRIRFPFSLLTLLLVSLVCGGAMVWHSGRHARWAAQLADPGTRDAALYNLLSDPVKPGDHEPGAREKCIVNHVVISPQPGGKPPVYLVFRTSGYKDEVSGPGIPRGHVIAIDSEGRVIPWYFTADWLTDESAIITVAADQPVQCLDIIPVGLSSNDAGVTLLYIVSATPKLDPVLLVAFNRDTDPPETKKWSHQVLDVNGVKEIQLGPKSADGTVDPRARFMWSASENRYTGPSGARPNSSCV